VNTYAWIILIALLAEALVNLLGNLVNLRSLEPTVPVEFEGTYDGEKYARSQDYTRATTRFGMVHSSFDLLVVLGFWLAGGFELLDSLVRGLERGPIVSGLVFLFAIGLGQKLLSLPFDLYSTFVVEERFGFNRTTPRTFWLDQIKGLLLSGLIGGPLLAAILFFFEHTGENAWLWCWGLTTVFAVGMLFIAPTWIMPLFNKFTLLEEGELRDRILAYSKSVDFPLSGIFIIDGSRRSTKANGFFTGFGKNKRIALYDTLVEGQETDELVAVVAHEIGHCKHKHIIKGFAVGIAHFGLLFWLLSFFLESPGLFAAFGLEQPSVYAGLVFFGLLYTPIEMVLSVAMNGLSRRNEFQADSFAARTTGNPEVLIGALKKLSGENLSNLTPHPAYVWLHYSHPPVLRRIEALRES
jgi:STE24 endopeptidase